ncbi:MAG: hypothetical protein JEZ00_12085 [Anaerolineaceae bacterium]|nr:hypothetical protein [Anaerolineaceae bacterium]
MTTDNKPAASPKSKLIIIVTAIVGGIIFCCCAIAFIIGIIYFRKDASQNPSSSTQDNPLSMPSNVQNLPEADPQTQTWLVMLYLDADDAVLEEDIYFDLNEAEMVGSSDRVQIVAQIDRNDEVFPNDGDWTSARRYFLTQDDDLNKINSEMVVELGEVDMGSYDTLIDFMAWAIESYPADKYVLIMSDHGSGWPGGWSDSTPQDVNGNWLSLYDLEYALSKTIANTGIGKLELIGLDACLMSMLEVYTALEPYSHYAVASQETEPALGWAYAAFLGKLADQPEMDGSGLGRAIVDSYINEDQRILNEEARELMLSSYGISDPMTANEVASEMSTNVTIAAVDLTSIPQLNMSLDNFLYSLKNVDQAKVAESRAYAQAFYNIFDEKFPSPYIDLSNFANFAASNVESKEVSQFLQELQAALSNTMIAEKHGNLRPGASGISVYFPVSELYWDEDFGYDYYTEASSRLADQTLWDDFLAFHYADQDFGLGQPSKELRIPAPGASVVTIAPLNITPTQLSPEDRINVQTDISGEQIANIYLVAMYQYEGRYLAYYIDYIKGDASREVDGVNYPVWDRTDNEIHIDLDWKPAPDAICNGSTCVFALVNPEKYTPDSKNLLYFVEGWYINSETGEKVEATIYFNNFGDNLIHHIIGSSYGNEALRMPREITPKPGDQFMVLDTWWTVDNDGQVENSYQEGNVLTFGGEPFYFVTVGESDPGDYAIGIMVEDMDGNLTYQFEPITVK